MKIAIIGSFPHAAKEQIINRFPEAWEVRILHPYEAAEEELRDADVLIPEHIKINAELLKKAPRLKLIQTGAGYDNVNLEDCTKYGVQVCNAAGVNANAVAEHVMAFILCWYKNITYLDTSGRKDYMIVWKCPANNYQEFSGNGILYISDYLVGGNDGRCFMLYNPDNRMAYGIVMDSDNISCSESKLMYDVLGLNSSQYSLLNVQPSQSYSGGGYSGSGGSSHYHSYKQHGNREDHSDHCACSPGFGSLLFYITADNALGFLFYDRVNVRVADILFKLAAIGADRQMLPHKLAARLTAHLIHIKRQQVSYYLT